MPPHDLEAHVIDIKPEGSLDVRTARGHRSNRKQRGHRVCSIKPDRKDVFASCTQRLVRSARWGLLFRRVSAVRAIAIRQLKHQTLPATRWQVHYSYKVPSRVLAPYRS